MSRSAYCGLSRGHRGELVTELAPRRETRWEPGRRQRRRGDPRRQAGAGPEYELAFTGRLLVTLARLRTGLAREALGVIYQAGSCAIGRAIGEIRPLLAGRGFAVPQRPGLRLRTLAGEDAAYAGRWPLLPPGFVITCAARTGSFVRVEGQQDALRQVCAYQRATPLPDLGRRGVVFRGTTTILHGQDGGPI